MPAVGLSFVLTGCTVGPDYQRPEVTLPDSFSETDGQSDGPRAAAPSVAADTEWWQRFDDPVLTELVQRAIADNFELDAAAARVRQARSLRQVASSGFLPEVNASADYRRLRASENGPVDLGTLSDAGLADTETNFYQVGFDASWEIDVFGGVRRRQEAAEAGVGAAAEVYRGVALTVIAEVVRNYVELRGAQLRGRLAEQNAAIQRRTLKLVSDRARAGLTPELDVVRARTQLRETEARVPLFHAQSRAAMHRLSVLVGAVPGGLVERLSTGAPVPVDGAPLPAGLPGELLLRRPDVRAAERQLHASTAAVGAATAELYPKFFISGAAGFESVSFSTLWNGSSGAGSVGPSIRWPIFRGGALRAQIAGAEAVVEEDYARFRQQVLVAVEEVERALGSHRQRQLEQAQLVEAVASARRAVELAQVLYERGLDDFLVVLDVERTLRAVEDRLATSEIAVSLQVVAIYKALGGGWQVADGGLASAVSADRSGN